MKNTEHHNSSTNEDSREDAQKKVESETWVESIDGIEWDGPVVNCTDGRLCHEELADPTKDCLIYRCSICFWYNDSCPYDFLPPSPNCPKVVCEPDPTPPPAPPGPTPTPSPPAALVWHIVGPCIAIILVLSLFVASCHLTYRALSPRRRRNLYLQIFQIDQFQEAHERSDRLQRDLEQMRQAFPEMSREEEEDHIETIEDHVARRDARYANENDSANGIESEESEEVNLRTKLVQQATQRREELSRRLQTSRGALSERIQSFRTRLPELNDRLRASFRRND